MMTIRTTLPGAALVSIVGACATSASADVVISTDVTQNMTCSGGICRPTASDAVLNVSDLENLLASGDVKVTTKGAGVQANNIDIGAALSWSAANALTLDAHQSITFSAVVQNQSSGNVVLVTNDLGTGGALTFAIGKGRLDTNAVSINGESYRMVNNVSQLAAKIVAKPRGNFALAKDTDASKDGLYDASPIPVPFRGKFNGLGHTIANLAIADMTQNSFTGLFASVKKSGFVASITLKNVVLTSQHYAGALVGYNNGTIMNSSSSGKVSAKADAGGLVGYNEFNGIIGTSQSSASVHAKYAAGGLVGDNYRTVALSFATGNVSGNQTVGGLIGTNAATVMNSYALGDVQGTRDAFVGGFVGYTDGIIGTSYSIGAVGSKGSSIGGFTGANSNGSIANAYWDTETSGQDQGSGDGNETGLTGLTTEQFQSGLPVGFDPAIWAEDANINNGFPYLIANPPAQ